MINFGTHVTLGSCQLFLLVLRGERISLTAVVDCYICLWFLWSLLECRVIANILMAVRPKWAKLIIICSPVILCLCFPSSVPYVDYLALSWPCFIIGMYARHSGFSQHHINKRWYWSTPIAILCFFLYRDDWYIYTNPLSDSIESIGIAIFRLIAALSAGSVFLALIASVSSRLPIAKMGTATLGIYIIQSVVFSLLSQTVLPAFLAQGWSMVLISIAIFLVSYYTYTLTRRIPLVGMLAYGDYK